jgi:hypothetical protein|tara:strand:+ start:430 stop:831 length:402 start_codon:yes stop_codon:yes gene_type:complete
MLLLDIIRERERNMAYISQKDKKELAPAIKAVLKKYNMKGSIGIRNYSTLVVNLKEGSLNLGNIGSINVYWIEDHFRGIAKNFLNELLVAMKGPNYYNNDDSMTDYYDRSHYTDINVGKWNKPYILTAMKEAA